MIVFIGGLFLRFYAIFIAIVVLFFIIMALKTKIIKLNLKKITDFVDYYFFKIFEHEAFTEKPKYKYKVNYQCHYNCTETCVFTDHNKDIKEAALFVLDFPELDNYINTKVKPFRAKFLNEVVQEKLRVLVLKKMGIKDEYCGEFKAVSTQGAC